MPVCEIEMQVSNVVSLVRVPTTRDRERRDRPSPIKERVKEKNTSPYRTRPWQEWMEMSPTHAEKKSHL